MIQVAEPLFCHCDEFVCVFSVPLICSENYHSEN